MSFIERRKRPARSVWGALVLTGCTAAAPGGDNASTLPYVAPTDASARLLMRGNLLNAESYEVDLFDDGEHCAGRRRLGSGVPGSDPRAVALSTRGPSTLEVTVRKPDRAMCRLRMSFDPLPGHSYAVYTNSSVGGCTTSLVDATNPDALRQEPSLKRRSEGAAECVPSALAKSAKLTADSLPHGGESVTGRPLSDLSGLIHP